MPKFVESDGVYSMAFFFNKRIAKAKRYYMLNEPWLQKKKFCGLSITQPQAAQSINWEGKNYNMITPDAARRIQFTLVDMDENEFVKDALINDYVTQLNGGQVRIFEPRHLWPNQSYVRLLDPAFFVANDTIIIFQFWYYD